MNNFNSNDNQNWQHDLQGKEPQEEAIRKSDQEKETKIYANEKTTAETDPEQSQLKQQISKEFWEKTYQDLSKGIVPDKIPNVTEEEVKKFYDDVQAKKYNSDSDSPKLEPRLRNSDAISPTVLQGKQEQEGEPCFNEGNKDFVSNTAHTIQMLDFLNYQKAVDGSWINRTFLQNQSQRAATPEKFGNHLKYTTRKEKTERLISSAKPRPNSLDYFDPDTVKNPPHQYQQFPEEQHQADFTEQNFKFELDEELPKQLSVRMEKMSPRVQPQYQKAQSEYQSELSKTQQLAQSTNIRNDPTFEEKNFVKTNLDSYYRTPEQFNRSADDEDYSGEKAPNAFNLGNDGEVNESFVERLNEKYRKAYIEANRLNNTSNRKYFAGKSQSISGAFVVNDIPFVDDVVARENKLVISLMVPQITDLIHVNDKTGPLSEDKVPRLRGSLSADQPRGSRNGYSGIRSPQSQDQSHLIKSKKENLDHRRAYVNRLIEQFDQQYIQQRPEKIEELREDQRLLEEKQNESPKRVVPKMYQNKNAFLKSSIEAEDFIVELTRSVTQGNGVIPAKHQSRLSELMSQLSTARQDKPVKSKVAEIISREKRTPNKFRLSQFLDNDLAVRNSGVQNVNEIGVMMAYLDDLSANLTAKYLESLKPKLSLASFKHGWTALLALLADQDTAVPTKNGKLDIDDITLSNYVSQSGKIKMKLQELPEMLLKHEISRGHLNEFGTAFEAFCDSIEENEFNSSLLPFFQYIYFIWRFLQLAKSGHRIRVKNEEKIEFISRKANEEYLLSAQKKKEDMSDESVHRKHVREAEEAYGINFIEWKRKLDEIDRENRLLKSNIHQEEVKKATEEKRLQKAQVKEQLSKELESRKEEILKGQKLQIEKKENEKKWLHEKNQRIIQYKRAHRAHQTEQKKKYQSEIMEQTLFESALKAGKIEQQKEIVRKECQERLEKLNERKQKKAATKEFEKQLKKEERAWERAQNLILRQRELLQEREQLNKSVRLSVK